MTTEGPVCHYILTADLIVPVAVAVADREPVNDIANKRPTGNCQGIDHQHPEHGDFIDVCKGGCEPSGNAQRIENHVESIMIVK